MAKNYLYNEDFYKGLSLVEKHKDEERLRALRETGYNDVVMASVDWCTVMFTDVSPVAIANLFGEDRTQFLLLLDLTPPTEQQGMFPSVTWTFNNIRVTFEKFAQWGLDCNCVARVDISSHGLNYLNSIGKEWTSRPFDRVLCGSYHFTRLDLAYDFFNIPYFMKETLDDVRRCDYWGKVRCNGSTKPKALKIVQSTGTTLYIGSATSKEMLRIYDKGAEQKSKNGNLLSSEYTYMDEDGVIHTPESWIRFELQLRHKQRIQQVYDSSDVKSMLKYILENYAMTDREGKWFSSWGKIKIKSELSTIIQNTNFEDTITSMNRAEKFFPRTRNTWTLLASDRGIDALYHELNCYLANLQLAEDPASNSAWRKLFAGMREGSMNYVERDPNTGLYQLTKHKTNKTL